MTLMDRCVEAWLACHGAIARCNRGSYKGASPDEILAEAGITFDRHRRLYLRYEREIRRRAWEAMGGKFATGGRPVEYLPHRRAS